MSDHHLAVNLPEEIRGGAYSDVVLVWHNQWGFTFDFLSQIGPEPVQVDDEGATAMPMQVVSRVRIPPGVIFPLLKALNENLTTYEAVFGPIAHPDAPEGQAGEEGQQS
jgi:hypothetical protein